MKNPRSETGPSNYLTLLSKLTLKMEEPSMQSMNEEGKGKNISIEEEKVFQTLKGTQTTRKA